MRDQQPKSDRWHEGRPLLAGVLVGGSSVRMGQPKTLLEYGGRTFVERVVTAVQELVEQVVLLGAGPVPVALSARPRLPDAAGLSGPLAGILAALRWHRTATWVIAACDLPLVRCEAVDWLLSERAPQHWAVLPRGDDGRVEPLLAVYEPAALALLEELLRRGCKSPSSLDGSAHVHTPPIPAALRACWTNVNRLEDFRRLGQAGDEP